MTGRERRLRTVLVVDDDASFRSLVVETLESGGFRSLQAATAGEALLRVSDDRPVAVLLDVCLPGISGYELCRHLKEDDASLPVIFLSGERTESFDRVAGLLLGADDYMTKPFAPDELLVRIRGVLERVSPTPSDRNSRLTPRELEVLRLLADGSNQPEIARMLGISPKTVGTHIERLLTKLGAHSRAEAVALAYRLRLVPVPA